MKCGVVISGLVVLAAVVSAHPLDPPQGNPLKNIQEILQEADPSENDIDDIASGEINVDPLSDAPTPGTVANPIQTEGAIVDKIPSEDISIDDAKVVPAEPSPIIFPVDEIELEQIPNEENLDDDLMNEQEQQKINKNSDIGAPLEENSEPETIDVPREEIIYYEVETPLELNINPDVMDVPFEENSNVDVIEIPMEENVNFDVVEMPMEENINFDVVETPIEENVYIAAIELPAEENIDFDAVDMPVEENVEFEAVDMPVEEIINFDVVDLPVEKTVFDVVDTPVEETVDFDAVDTPVKETVDFDAVDTPVEETVDFDAVDTPVEEILNFDAIDTPVEEVLNFDEVDMPVEENLGFKRVDTPVEENLYIAEIDIPVEENTNVDTVKMPVEEDINLGEIDTLQQEALDYDLIMNPQIDEEIVDNKDELTIIGRPFEFNDYGSFHYNFDDSPRVDYDTFDYDALDYDDMDDYNGQQSFIQGDSNIMNGPYGMEQSFDYGDYDMPLNPFDSGIPSQRNNNPMNQYPSRNNPLSDMINSFRMPIFFPGEDRRINVPDQETPISEKMSFGHNPQVYSVVSSFSLPLRQNTPLDNQENTEPSINSEQNIFPNDFERINFNSQMVPNLEKQDSVQNQQFSHPLMSVLSQVQSLVGDVVDFTDKMNQQPNVIVMESSLSPKTPNLKLNFGGVIDQPNVELELPELTDLDTDSLYKNTENVIDPLEGGDTIADESKFDSGSIQVVDKNTEMQPDEIILIEDDENNDIRRTNIEESQGENIESDMINTPSTDELASEVNQIISENTPGKFDLDIPIRNPLFAEKPSLSYGYYRYPVGPHFPFRPYFNPFSFRRYENSFSEDDGLDTLSDIAEDDYESAEKYYARLNRFNRRYNRFRSHFLPIGNPFYPFF